MIRKNRIMKLLRIMLLMLIVYKQQEKYMDLKKKTGKKSLVEKFPALAACATDFIKSNSFGAQNCRRETMGTGTGVSLKDLLVSKTMEYHGILYII